MSVVLTAVVASGALGITATSAAAQLLQIVVTHQIVKVKVGSKIVSKTVTKTTKILLASSSYHLSKGNAATISLELTLAGQRVLKAAAKTPFHETASVSVKRGVTTTKQVVVS